MTQITNNFERVLALHSESGLNIGNEEFNMTLLIAIKKTIANAVHIAQKITGITDVKVTLVSDSDKNYNAVYIKEENSSIIQYNIADLTFKILAKMEEEYSSDFIEKFVFAISLSVILHEFGHHHHDSLKDAEMKYIEDGLQLINYVENKADLVSLSDLEKDPIFFNLLLKAQTLRIEDEMKADAFSESYLKNCLSPEINTIIKEHKDLIKDFEYYWFYASEFLKILTEIIVSEFTPNDNIRKEFFIQKLLIKCKAEYIKQTASLN